MLDSSQFKNTAIMLIYPDGKIDKLTIDGNLLHMNYFIELLGKSSYFLEFIHKNNLKFTDKKGRLLNISTYNLDINLTSLGVIIIRNLNIYELKNQKDFAKNNIPQYAIGFPQVPTPIQVSLMNELFNTIDLKNSFYYCNIESNLRDITYEDALNILGKNRLKI